MTRTVKKRNWAFVLYPDSVPDDWVEILRLTGLEIAISPLHDKDEDEGKPKKAHWHVIAVYNGPTSSAVVERLSVEKLKGTKPIALEAVKGYYRYLTHMDNPEKAQYDESEIQLLNGFDEKNYNDLTATQKDQIKLDVIKLIEEMKIVEYRGLVLSVLDNPDMFGIVSTQTMFFNAYLGSFRHTMKKKQLKDASESKRYKKIQVIDSESGELIDEYFEADEEKQQDEK